MSPTGWDVPARPRGRRRRLAAAVAAGLVLLVFAMGATRPRIPDPATAPDAQRPGMAQVAEGAGAYRLRVRGLSPLIEDASSGPARIEIGARMGAAGEGGILIEARLLDETTGRTLWEGVYRAIDAGPDTVRRLVGEALRDAMTLTKEGAGGHGQEI